MDYILNFFMYSKRPIFNRHTGHIPHTFKTYVKSSPLKLKKLR